ncbi:MAG: SEC-C metal-binding domain-containing protein [Acidimicrobiia bacterium]
MDLDRGTLARIDRKVLSGLDHDESYRMVRLPVTEATWSTWKRYCDAVGTSMGRAIADLIHHELRSVVEEIGGETVFLGELPNEVAERQRALDARERSLEIREQRLGTDLSRIWHDPVASRPPTIVAKVGRNDSCPCGAGVKYKRCHGA